MSDVKHIERAARKVKEAMVLKCAMEIEKTRQGLPPNKQRLPKGFVINLINDAKILAPSIKEHDVYDCLNRRKKNGLAGTRITTNVIKDITVIANRSVNRSVSVDGPSPSLTDNDCPSHSLADTDCPSPSSTETDCSTLSFANSRYPTSIDIPSPSQVDCASPLSVNPTTVLVDSPIDTSIIHRSKGGKSKSQQQKRLEFDAFVCAKNANIEMKNWNNSHYTNMIRPLRRKGDKGAMHFPTTFFKKVQLFLIV